MKQLTLHKAGKKYSKEWIFRDLSYTFTVGKPVAITGPNGAGKSTLVKAISGVIPLNEGKIEYDDLPEDVWHKYLGISAPYLELIEEFTLKESVDFHQKFRPLISGMSTLDFLEKLNLEKHSNKFIRDFSSGMKQKLKLGFAFFSENEVLILDEPTANIDHKGYEWYMEEVQKLLPHKIVLISSNEPKEYTFCQEQLSILDFKVQS